MTDKRPRFYARFLGGSWSGWGVYDCDNRRFVQGRRASDGWHAPGMRRFADRVDAEVEAERLNGAPSDDGRGRVLPPLRAPD